MYSQYGSYKPLDFPTPVCVLTCGPRWEVLQRRSLHHSIRLAHHKHFIEYCVVVDEALDHARRLDVMQVFFTEDNGHLVGRRKMTQLHLNIKQSKQPFKPTPALSEYSKRGGMKTILAASQGY